MPLGFNLLVKRTWAGIHPAHAGLINDMHLQIVLHSYLTGQTDVVGEFRFHRETIAFEFTHFAWISGENFHAASGAASIATAAVQDVDPGIFDCQDKFFPFGASKACTPVAVSASILGMSYDSELDLITR